MPSPFPGMDPYLEDPVLWPGVHAGVIGGIRWLLNSRLPDNFIADIGERVYVVESEKSLYPDAGIFEIPESTAVASGRAASVEVNETDPPLMIQDRPIEVRETYVEIRAVRPDRQLIGVIEVVSPANKYAGTGRDTYLAKQEEVLNSECHLIEIDLLRGGPHTVAVSAFRIRARRGRFDYLACLHRAGAARLYATWPVRLQQRLPRIVVPLLEGMPDVKLDLQEAFNRCYHEGAYDRQIDYRQNPPAPRLSLADAAWADALLRERGLRS